MKIITLIREADVIACVLRRPGMWKQPPDPHEIKNLSGCAWAGCPRGFWRWLAPVL